MKELKCLQYMYYSHTRSWIKSTFQKMCVVLQEATKSMQPPSLLSRVLVNKFIEYFILFIIHLFIYLFHFYFFPGASHQDQAAVTNQQERRPQTNLWPTDSRKGSF